MQFADTELPVGDRLTRIFHLFATVQLLCLHCTKDHYMLVCWLHGLTLTKGLCEKFEILNKVSKFCLLYSVYCIIFLHTKTKSLNLKKSKLNNGC